MAENYGWAGKVLRVDLTTGAITTESTDKYKAFLGGTGPGWKVLWDEVPPGTKAWDAANRLVFAVGPLTGGGSPCSGRTSIVTRWPVNADELPAAGHFGGHWGPELKYAGYDGVIVQGKAAKPVWLRIEDDKVTLEDAAEIWGQGIYRSTNYIEGIMGTEAHVAAIGPAGENLVRMAAVFTDRSHRAGGAGSVMGSKNLKAVAVRGTGAVKIKADKKAWKDLNKYYLSLMGANNQCVVARELQPWSEFSPGGTRWSGAPGILWGAAMPPVNTGTCPDVEHPAADAPSPLNKIGLRTQKGYNDFGAEGMRRTVRMDGCHACPIRCHIAADHPELQSYGLTRYNMNTCMGNSGSAWYTNTAGSNAVSNPMLLAYMANNLEGDYGIWNDYGGWHYVFKWLYSTKLDVTAPISGFSRTARSSRSPPPRPTASPSGTR
jgi:aldehyde:ferredoxin oxidoreductase